MKMQSKNIKLFLMLIVTFASVSPLYADIYVYIDKAGVRHFTNAPTSSEYKVYLKSRPSYFDSDFSYSPPSSSYSYWSNEYDHLINQASQLYDIPFPLVKAMIKVESNFNPFAISPRGAAGILQLMPQTAKRFGVKNVFDATQNIDGGARYLRWLLDRFNGRVELALAGYNAGEGAVDRHHGIPPFAETKWYVIKVLDHVGRTAPKPQR